MARKIDWLKVAVGTYLVLPFAPEDIGTGGATIIPSGILGSYLILSGLKVL